MSDLETGVVRPWVASDLPLLLPLVLDLMREQRRGGSLVVPSPSNAEMIIREGVTAAEAGDPCLVAFDDTVDPSPVGCCVWMGRPTPLVHAARVCHALGMYVREDRREMGWSQRIYDAAIVRARAAGYEAAEGLAVRKAGLHAAMRTGAVPVGVVLRRPL